MASADVPVAPAQGSFKVGDWVVESDLNQISVRGRTVKLEPKAMGVLVCLAHQPGQVVSREALLSRLWSGVVVGDDSLSQVITKLRKALGDDPERPTYIHTVTKRGYRLVAPVARPAGNPSSPAGQRRQRGQWIAIGATLGMLAAGLWLAAAQYPWRSTPGAVPAPDVTQLPTVAIAPF